MMSLVDFLKMEEIWATVVDISTVYLLVYQGTFQDAEVRFDQLN